MAHFLQARVCLHTMLIAYLNGGSGVAGSEEVDELVVRCSVCFSAAEAGQVDAPESALPSTSSSDGLATSPAHSMQSAERDVEFIRMFIARRMQEKQREAETYRVAA